MSKPGHERRKYARMELPCPITLHDGEGNVIHQTRTVNVSDGGAFLSIPLEALPAFEHKLDVMLAVPRTTPNTYMLEDFRCAATVVRHQPLTKGDLAGLAVQFATPQQLMLEV